MSVEIFLKIPAIEGECTAKGHEKEIEVFSFSLGASNPSSVATGAGMGAGKVDISTLSIQKQLDLASDKLFKNCCNGTHFEKATVTVREAGGESPLEYYILELKQVFIDSINWGAASGGEKPSESVSLSFGEVKMTYWSQDEKGGKGQKGEVGWSLKKNAPAA